MKAVIKLWGEDREPLAELIVPQDNYYVERVWKMADEMALNLSHSDNWGLEMTITADYANPAPKKLGERKE